MFARNNIIIMYVQWCSHRQDETNTCAGNTDSDSCADSYSAIIHSIHRCADGLQKNRAYTHASPHWRAYFRHTVADNYSLLWASTLAEASFRMTFSDDREYIDLANTCQSRPFRSPGATSVMGIHFLPRTLRHKCLTKNHFTCLSVLSYTAPTHKFNSRLSAAFIVTIISLPFCSTGNISFY